MFPVLPLFLFTQPNLGGLGFEPLIISLFFAGAGISQAIWTLVFLPPLQCRFGTGGLLRGCSIAWPITFAIWPISNLFMRQHREVAFWIVAPINMVLGSGVSMAFSESPDYVECIIYVGSEADAWSGLFSRRTIGTQRYIAYTCNTRYSQRPCSYPNIRHSILRSSIIFKPFCDRRENESLSWVSYLDCLGSPGPDVDHCDPVVSREGGRQDQVRDG